MKNDLTLIKIYEFIVNVTSLLKDLFIFLNKVYFIENFIQFLFDFIKY